MRTLVRSGDNLLMSSTKLKAPQNEFPPLQRSFCGAFLFYKLVPMPSTQLDINKELQQAIMELKTVKEFEVMLNLKTFVDITDDLNAGSLLSQIMYWYSPNEKGQIRCGDTLIKQRKDWWDEIRFSPKMYDRASAILISKSLISVKTVNSPLYGGKNAQEITLHKDRLLTLIREKLNQTTDQIDRKATLELPKGEHPNYPKVNSRITQRSIPSITKNITENSPESGVPPFSRYQVTGLKKKKSFKENENLLITLEKIKDFCKENEINEKTGIRFFNKFQKDNWTYKGKPIFNWKNLLLSWHNQDLKLDSNKTILENGASKKHSTFKLKKVRKVDDTEHEHLNWIYQCHCGSELHSDDLIYDNRNMICPNCNNIVTF